MEKCAQLMLLVAVLLRAVRTWNVDVFLELHVTELLDDGRVFFAAHRFFRTTTTTRRSGSHVLHFPCSLSSRTLVGGRRCDDSCTRSAAEESDASVLTCGMHG